MAENTEAAKSYEKLNELRRIEKLVQERWNEEHVFEGNAPRDFKAGETKRKFMATFPFPYMNGLIHLGHLFTITKAEFATAFHRMLGEDALFPFAFHCTGMPICGAARRLKDELDGVTKPVIANTEGGSEGVKDLTQFHSRRSKLKAKTGTGSNNNEQDEDPCAEEKENCPAAPKEVTYSTGKQQAHILVEMGIGDNEESLRPFTDPAHWVEYFPPLGQKDLKEFGLRVDWRRSFITTDANPYFDAFVKWQFEHLKEGGFIRYGTRNSIYCPVENEACPDHDRLIGESINPQDYVCILMKVIDNQLFSSIMRPVKEGYNGETTEYITNEEIPESERVDVSGYQIFLAAATLRPETTFGQTNCWIKMSGVYGVYEKADQKRLIVCTHRAARNMCYQGSLDYTESSVGRIPKCLGLVSGKLLINHKIRLTTPLSINKEIPLLPMDVVDMNIGTGIVMSVPADAPHDYISLMDLQKPKSLIRDEAGLTLDDVKDIKPVSIIHVPGLGDEVDGELVKDENDLNLSAMYVCRRLKVASQKDEKKLALAKEECYKKGFYEGVMLVGESVGIKGMKVAQAKDVVKDYLIENNMALAYSEPNGRVVSRSNGECVVCPCTQWYISYGSEAITPEQESDSEAFNWKQRILSMLEEMRSFGSQETKKQLKHTIEWMSDWGCSRGTGLGTKLPFDEKYLIESLSDSTIYMAYYTIAHLLQSDLYGTPVKIDGKDGIPVSMCDREFFDSIFFGKVLPPEHPINKDPVYKAQMDVLRREFNYWYPVDLRVSGKDLVCNHLVMFMYNHAAIWNKMNVNTNGIKTLPGESEEQAIDRCYHPKGIRASGHICVDGKKMSKSAGNFIISKNAVEMYGCDALRIGLAEGGDGYDDANFVQEETSKNILWLTVFLSNVKDIVKAWSECGCNNQDVEDAKALSYEDNIFLARLLSMEQSCRTSLMLMRYREFMTTMRNIRKVYSDYNRMCTNTETQKSSENLELSMRYIINYVIMLSVVAPHICDYIWKDIIGPVALSKLASCYKPSSLLDLSKYDFSKSLYSQGIPLITLTEAEKRETSDGITPSEDLESVQEDKRIDDILSQEEITKYLKIWNYLNEVTSIIGKRIVAFNNAQKKGKSPNGEDAAAKLTNRSKVITIVVATELPEMEQKVINLLRPQYNYDTHTFLTDPKQIVRPLMDALAPSEAKQKGKIMSFAIATAKEALSDPAVFDNEHIDECAVLENFKSYFINTYNVASVSVTLDNSNPIAKPGRPMILIEMSE